MTVIETLQQILERTKDEETKKLLGEAIAKLEGYASPEKYPYPRPEGYQYAAPGHKALNLDNPTTIGNMKHALGFSALAAVIEALTAVADEQCRVNEQIGQEIMTLQEKLRNESVRGSIYFR